MGHKNGRRYLPFTRMRSLDMVFEQTTPFEGTITGVAFVSFVIEMCGTFVGHQIGSLSKT